MATLGLLLLANGCSRPFWRDQANRDSYDATAENFTDPRWQVPRIDVTPDPRSRFFDPYDEDYEPLPPDDPAAHAYMHWVDGWQGYDGWHDFGQLLSVENPQWLLPFNMTPENFDKATGTYIGSLPEIKNLTLGEALELALINNREYQSQIEDVFLAALAVTGERFRFSVRYLNSAGQTPGGSVLGAFAPQGGSDEVGMSAGAGISQFLPTGGQWVIELANNTIWLFGGGNETATASTLSFALTQPLLRGAGRKVVLESLTQAERDLLYAVRDLARFRRVFFTSIVGGPNGYLALLQQVQQIRNTEANILRLEEQVEALTEVSSQTSQRIREPLAELPDGLVFPDALADRIRYVPIGGDAVDPDLNDPDAPVEGELDESQGGELIWFTPLDIEESMTEEQAAQLLALSDDPSYQRAVTQIIQRVRTETVSLDVLLLQSTLANTVQALRQQEVRLQDSLDDFKILLGLPTDFVMTLDDELLDPFQFMDPQLIELEQEIKDFIPIWGQLDDEEPDRDQLRLVAERFQVLQQRAVNSGLDLVRTDFERLKEVFPERMESLETDAERERLDYDVRRDRRLFDSAVLEMEGMSESVNRIAERSNDKSVPIDIVKEWVFDLKDNQETLIKTVQSLQAIEVGLRVELVDLQPYEYTLEESVQIGLENRLDLKNAQAQVMDARRQIEVAANALKSVLDLEIAADFRTPPLASFDTEPFRFMGDLSDLNVGLSLDTPIDQINERNIYRQSLINYQRARREYMLAEDLVKQDIRTSWRQLEILRLNLETARQALRIAVARFDSAVEQAYEPPRVGQTVSRGSGLQGQNIQQALSSVLNAQNNIVGIWVDHERSRLNIYRDMGIMDIGPDNVWEDPFYRRLTEGEGNSVYGSELLPCPVDGPLLPTESETGDGPPPPQPEEGPAVDGPPADASSTGIGTDEHNPGPVPPRRVLGPLE